MVAAQSLHARKISNMKNRDSILTIMSRGISGQSCLAIVMMVAMALPSALSITGQEDKVCNTAAAGEKVVALG